MPSALQKRLGNGLGAEQHQGEQTLLTHQQLPKQTEQPNPDHRSDIHAPDRSDNSAGQPQNRLSGPGHKGPKAFGQIHLRVPSEHDAREECEGPGSQQQTKCQVESREDGDKRWRHKALSNGAVIVET